MRCKSASSLRAANARMELLAGKTACVLGVANRWRIATAIARALHAHGASLILTYEGERTQADVEKLALELGNAATTVCDVSKDESIAALHDFIGARKQPLNFSTTRSGFSLALDISAYSLVALCRALQPLFAEQASVMTMTYLGSVRAVKNYNVMGVAKAALEASVRYLAVDLGEMGGVRVNAISAGPIKTASARAVGDFTKILSDVAAKSPLRRNAIAEDVANTAVFLASDLSSAVTGQTLYVDAGYNILGIV